MAGAFDEECGGMQLPHIVGQAVLAWFKAANVGTSSYPFLTMANANLLIAHGSQEQVDTYVGPMLEGRWFGTMAPLRAAGRLLAGRHHHPRRAAGRRHLPADRQQDVDLGRRPRADREHRPPGAGQDPRRTGRREGHLAVRRPEVPGERRRLAGRAQRRRPRRAEPQDGLPRDDEHAAQLRRGRAHARAGGPARSATWSASRTAAWPTCST